VGCSHEASIVALGHLAGHAVQLRNEELALEVVSGVAEREHVACGCEMREEKEISGMILVRCS